MMLFRSLKRCAESICLYFLSFLIRRDNQTVAIGSWNGERYADNSKYLAEYIAKNRPDLKIVWVGKACIKDEVMQNLPGAEFVEINTFAANLKLLKCKYLFFSHMHSGDISCCHVYRKAVTCYLHHGMPIKKWGKDGLNQDDLSGNMIRSAFYHIVGTDIKYDYFVTSSPLHDRTNCSSLSEQGCCEEKNIHSGTPRNDLFFQATKADIRQMKEKYGSLLGFDPGKRVLLYLPTYRRTATGVFSFSSMPEDQRSRISELLQKSDSVLIEKSHYTEKNTFKGISDDRIICVPGRMNPQEMMLFADVLISDYSGAFLDYLILDRPIIHYLYDYQYYRDVDSGLYYEPEEFCAGIAAYRFEDLERGMEQVLFGADDRYKDRRRAVRNRFMSYEKGTASETIVNTVTGDQSGNR